MMECWVEQQVVEKCVLETLESSGRGCFWRVNCLLAQHSALNHHRPPHHYYGCQGLHMLCVAGEGGGGKHLWLCHF